jgi:hypothetical protein
MSNLCNLLRKKYPICEHFNMQEMAVTLLLPAQQNMTIGYTLGKA